MNDNFENNDDCSTAAEECERFDIIENDILNNIGNQSVSDEKNAVFRQRRYFWL